MPELIVLDPSEVSTNRTEFDITYLASSEGLDWGEAAIAAVMAQSERGTLPVDFTLPNRLIKIPLRVKNLGEETFDSLRVKLQAKVARYQDEGGWLKRQRGSLPALYADIVNATLAMPDSWMQAHRDAEPNAVLTLEAIFDFYEEEVELTDDPLTGTDRISTVFEDVRGDMPGRIRIEVTDEGNAQARGLIGALRSRHYSAAPTAQIYYPAEDMTPIAPADAASVIDPLISSLLGTDGIGREQLSTGWEPVMNTNLVADDDYLTHVGTYRCWARVAAASQGPPQLRFVYDVGDLLLPEENDPATIPAAPIDPAIPLSVCMVDLGTVRLDKDSAGDHRWQGQIQAKGLLGGESVFIGEVFFFPIDEWYGVYRAPKVIQPTQTISIARDPFDQVAGPAASGAAPFGGNWDAGTPGSSTALNGDGDDFEFSGPPDNDLVRDEGADTSQYNGRFLVLDGASDISEVTLQADVALEAWDPSSGSGDGFANLVGFLARFQDTDNWLMAVMEHRKPSSGYYVWVPPVKDKTGYEELVPGYWLYVSTETPQKWIALYKNVAGTVEQLGELYWQGDHSSDWCPMKVTVDENGRAQVFFIVGQGNDVGVTAWIDVTDPDLAAAGPLNEGQIGVYAAHDLTGTSPKAWIDNFLATAPIPGQITDDAILFPNRRAELRTDGAVREAPDGGSFGPIAYPIGRQPRMPAGGLEARDVELFLRRSASDFGTVPDDENSEFSARVFVKSAWLYGPDAA